ncbi:Forkhead-associated domain containing protein, partial [Nannochloropsis gaditana]
MLAAIASQHEKVEASMKIPPSFPAFLSASPCVGKVIVLRRNGKDGGHFPLTRGHATIGRHENCDIRIALPWVSRKHAELRVIDAAEGGEAGHGVVVTLTNFSDVNPTSVNGTKLQKGTKGTARLRHGDVFVVADRSFRFEYTAPPGEDGPGDDGEDAEATLPFQEGRENVAPTTHVRKSGNRPSPTATHQVSACDKENLSCPSKNLRDANTGPLPLKLKNSEKYSSPIKQKGKDPPPPPTGISLRPKNLPNRSLPAIAKDVAASPPPSLPRSAPMKVATIPPSLRAAINARRQSYNQQPVQEEVECAEEY